MAKRFNHQIPAAGYSLGFSGDELAGIHVTVESGSLECAVEWEGSSEDKFVIPARREWSTLPLLRTGLKHVTHRPDPANATPLPVVSYDIGAHAGIVTLGGALGEVGSIDADHPGDGSWTAAPDAASPTTETFAFTVSGFTVYVKTAAVQIRVSFDGGTTVTGTIVLEPGVHQFDEWSATDVIVEEDVDAGGGEYQIVGVA